ncbi:hypothetical protein [Flavobacterium sp. C4GT6]|uniref:hypothetical protein n=1 Tax=Flavobacterium sp. C4GT6 TaxID=3103818 RepID=UPI002ED2A366
MTTTPSTKTIIIVILPMVVLTATLSIGTTLLFYSLHLDKESFNEHYRSGFLWGVAILNTVVVLLLLILSSFYRPTVNLWRNVLTLANVPPAIVYLLYFSTTFPYKP